MADPSSGADAQGNSAQERPQVSHDAAVHRFFVTVDGVDGVVDYHREGAVMVLTHTTVPAAIGGRGIAGQLVKAAFDHARTQGWRVRPACTYASAWAKRHPEYLPLIE